MRLLQIAGGGNDQAVLDFHPMITVVTGLSPAARDRLVRAITALPSGSDPGVGGLVEAHGVLMDLAPDTLALLGLHADLDVLVRPHDLPGSAPLDAVPVASPEPEVVERQFSRADVQAFIDETPAGEYEELDHARARRADAQAALTVFQEAVANARREYERVLAEQRMAQATLDAAMASPTPRLRLVTGEGADEGPAGPSAEDIRRQRSELQDRIADLEDQLARIARGLEELTSIDTRPLQVLLDAIRNPQPIEYVPSERAHELADEFVTLQGRVNELEAALEAEGQGSATALRQLEAARAELAAAEKAMAKPELTREDIDELEAAHEAVLEAEKKATGAFKRGGQRRLEEARQRERTVLDRVGFPTWSSYVMGASLLAIDHAAEQRLEKARLDLEEAEAHWALVVEVIEGNPEHRELLEKMEAVFVESYDLLGGEEPDDLEKALRELQVPKREVTTDELVEALNYQLELVGLQLGDTPTPDLVVMAADAFLEEAGAVSGRIAELRDEQGSAQAALAVARRQLDELPEEPDEAEDLAEPRAQAAGAESDPWGLNAPRAMEPTGGGPTGDGNVDPTDPFGLGALDGSVDDAAPAESGTGEASGSRSTAATDLDPVEDGAGSDERQAEFEPLERQLSDASAEVGEYLDWLESREALLDATIQVESVATSRLMKVAADLLAQAAPPVVPEPSPLPPPPETSLGLMAEGEATVESIEFYLLARLAAQRSVAIAGSVPLVVDDALRDLSAEDVQHVLRKLEQMAETVQIVYLSDDDDVIGWASEVGIRKAAVVPAPVGFG